MSKFANKEDGVGMRISSAPYVAPEDRSGFDALGYPVPQHRKSAADLHMKEMGVEDPESRWGCIGRMSDKIARDQPHDALDLAMKYLDATGCYRLLSVLLTAPEATE